MKRNGKYRNLIYKFKKDNKIPKKVKIPTPIRTELEPQNISTDTVSALEQFVPWSMKNRNLTDVWQDTRGTGVTVAIIDSGINYAHEEIESDPMSDNFFHRGLNMVKKDGSLPIDDNGHGTAVAGIIMANADNNAGYLGLAPDCKIVALKVLDAAGSGYMSSVFQAIRLCVRNGVDIINLSLGSNTISDTERQLINSAVEDYNVVIFAAAGNNGGAYTLPPDVYNGSGPDPNYSTIDSPAVYEGTIAIGSCDPTDLASPTSSSTGLFVSNYTSVGPELDFLAPGTYIPVPYSSSGNYTIVSGTSFACPYAVGCAALICSYAKTKNLKLTKQNYIDIFKLGAINVSSLQEGEVQNSLDFDSDGVVDPMFQGNGCINLKAWPQWKQFVDGLLPISQPDPYPTTTIPIETTTTTPVP